MAITASLVKELRERSGAGMMECKKALVATDGDMEAAAEHLRKSGLASADKKSGRVAAEGIIAMASSDGGNKAVMVEINSETDFVAKDDNFLAFTSMVGNAALGLAAGDIEALLNTVADDKTIEEHRQALVAKVGENIQVRRSATLETDSGIIGSYLHGGKIGVLIELNGGSVDLARDLAMHIAAINPQFVSADDVSTEVLEKEKNFLVSQARESGKPDNIIEKMIEGRMRKFMAEITLVGQPFVKDTDVTVEKLLKQNEASVVSFKRMAVGEGIEKKEENFADEVMAQVKRD